MSESVTESVARKFAEDRVEWFRTNPINVFGIQVRYLDDADGERFASYAVARCLIDGSIEPAHAARSAQAGDPLFYDALCLLAAVEMEDNMRLPDPLRGLVIATLRDRPRLKRARRLETNYFRDICITMLVQEVRDGFGLSLYGRSAKRTSACGIVAQTLGMEYEAVRKAIRNFVKEI